MDTGVDNMVAGRFRFLFSVSQMTTHPFGSFSPSPSLPSISFSMAYQRFPSFPYAMQIN
jgi:hypothetical protein